MRRFVMPLVAAALGIGIAAAVAAPARAQFLGMTVPSPDYHTIDWCSWETITESQAQEVYDQYFKSTRLLGHAIREHQIAIGRLTDSGVTGALGALAFARVFGGKEGLMQGIAYEIGDRLPKLLKYTTTLTRLRQHYRIQRRILDCMGERLETFQVAREKRKKFGEKVPDWLPGALDRMAEIKRELGENKKKLDEIRIFVSPFGGAWIQVKGVLIPIPWDVQKIPGMPKTWEEAVKRNPQESWVISVVSGVPVAVIPVRTNQNGELFVPGNWNAPAENPPGDQKFIKTYPVGDLVAPPQTAKVPGGGNQNLDDQGQLNQPTAGAKDWDFGITAEYSTGFKFMPGWSVTQGAAEQTETDGSFRFDQVKIEGVLRLPGLGRKSRVGVTGIMRFAFTTDNEGDFAGRSTITSINGLNTQNIAAVKDVTLEREYRRDSIKFWMATGLPVPEGWKDTDVEIKGGFVWEREQLDESFHQQVTGNGVNFFLHGLESEIRSNFYGVYIGADFLHRLPGRWQVVWGMSTILGARDSRLELTQLPGTFGANTVQINDTNSTFSVRAGGHAALGHDIFDNLRIMFGVRGYYTNDAPVILDLSTPGRAARLGSTSGGAVTGFVRAKLVFPVRNLVPGMR